MGIGHWALARNRVSYQHSPVVTKNCGRNPVSLGCASSNAPHPTPYTPHPTP
ncbi:MAG: hypothetical protein F6J93_10580 [Oscillatoria sp. SIO1A7]|nr:hypothetical protein [Oscillatoria sp. SIO1A7]